MTSYQKNFGPFAIAQQHANNFCHNFFLSNAVNQCVLQLAKIEEEKRLIKFKKLEKVEKFKKELFQFSNELNEINNSFNQNSILNNETFHLPKKIDKKNQQFSKK